MTVWEWLVVLTLVAGFSAVLVAGAKRAPLVDQARTLKNELEEIDRAIRQAESSGQFPADGRWDPVDYLPLVREKFTRLRQSGQDPFGHPYPPVPTGSRPTVPFETQAALIGQLSPSFWSPFLPSASPDAPTPGDNPPSTTGPVVEPMPQQP